MKSINEIICYFHLSHSSKHNMQLENETVHIEISAELQAYLEL